MRVPNRYTNEQDFWLFADFPVAYDPCTCLFSSRIRFTFQLIQSTDANLSIALEGTSYLKQVIKAQPNGGVLVNGTDFSILDDVNGFINSGVKGYKNYSGFATGASGIVNFLSTVNGIAGKQKDDIDAFKNIMRLGQTIPYLGGMLGVFDFLLGGGRKDSPDAAPVAFEANLNHKLTGSATGKFELTIPRGDRILKTPGSLPDGTAAVPNYDNVLGLFAILETPKVEYALWEDARTNGALGREYANPDYDPNCNQGYDENGYPLCPPATYYTQIGVLDNRLKQYHLSQDIKFAVNPASDLLLDDLKFALVVENVAQSDQSFATWAASFGDVYPYQSEQEKLNKLGYEPETDRRFRTPFLLVGCITSTSIMVAQPNSRAVDYQEPKVYLKVRAIFKRKDAAAGVQPVIYLATYNVDLARSVSDPGNLKFDKFYTSNNNGFNYADGYYYNFKSQPIFPAPIAGIAGVNNPSYPMCSNRVVAQQSASQLQSFCQDANRYNPQIAMRRSSSSVDAGQHVDQLRCFPNPIHGSSIINYEVASSTAVSLQLINNMGQVVKILVDSKLQKAGSYEIKFEDASLSKGLYYVVLQTDSGRTSIKVMLE